MTDQERYEQVDLPFYREEIAPVLPAMVLDCHVLRHVREGVTLAEAEQRWAEGAQGKT